jgi:hypothetical protein
MKKITMLFLIILLSVKTGIVNAQVKPMPNNKIKITVQGATNLMITHPPAVGKVATYKYKSKNREYKIECFQYQSGHVFKATDQFGESEYIAGILTDVIHNGKELLPLDYNSNNSILFMYQHDIDFDGVDELAIGVHLQMSGPTLPELNNGVAIIYYKIINNKWVPLKVRGATPSKEYLLNEGEIQGLDILGSPNIVIKGNTLTVNRNLRGFYFKYLFESNGVNQAHNY